MPKEFSSQFRSGFALAIYRGLLAMILLAGGFKEFPEHKSWLVFAVLAFNGGIAAVMHLINLQFDALTKSSHLSDVKTRYAIQVASEREWGDQFWTEVNRRVRDEMPDPDPPASWWFQVGLTLLSLLGRIASDVCFVGFVVLFFG